MYPIDLDHQRLMNEAFFRHLPDYCQPDENPSQILTMSVGLETEYLLIDEQGNLIDESTRNLIVEALPGSTSELCAASLETRTDPFPIVGEQTSLLQAAMQMEHIAHQQARQAGCYLVRIGSHPGSFEDILVSQFPDRYQWLMDTCHTLHGDKPQQTIGTLLLPQDLCRIMGACQATHLNIQVAAGQPAIHLLNQALEMVPYLLALAANSPLMHCQASGFQETRTPLWEVIFNFAHVDEALGVDTRRVGMPDDYYSDWEAYWRDVGNKLFLTNNIEHAFASNVKNFWRAVRLKPCPGQRTSCLLEIRTIGVQPTIQEDVALHLLFYGLLSVSLQQPRRPLLPMNYVKTNLTQASRHGLNAQLYTLDETGVVRQEPARAIVATLLQKAIAMWQRVSPEAVELLQELKQRLDPAIDTPACQSLRLYQQALASGHTPQQAAHHVLLANTLI